MNIKELAKQAEYSEKVDWYMAYDKFDLERFAELVRQDLYQEIGKGVITQINGAVLMEREACAKLCEEMLTEPMLVGWNGFQHYMTQCAQRIRERGDKHEHNT